MSPIKTALKAIGTLIQAAKYDDAVEQARKLLATDPKNYQAYVSLARNRISVSIPRNWQ
jgi:superkiller protein 3